MTEKPASFHDQTQLLTFISVVLGLISAPAAIYFLFVPLKPGWLLLLVVLAPLIYWGRLKWRTKARPEVPTSNVWLLRPYDKDSTAMFLARPHIRREIIRKIEDGDAARPVSVVIGSSGVGKSSLIQREIVPHFRKTMRVELINTYPSAKTLKQTLALLSSVQADDDQRTLIVLDQFEQFFINLRAHDRREFLQTVNDVLQTSKYHLLIAIRSDWLSELREFSGLMPRLEDMTHVGLFSRDEATLAIRKLAEQPEAKKFAACLPKPNGLAEKIVEALAEADKDDLISPIELQMVCFAVDIVIGETKSPPVTIEPAILINGYLDRVSKACDDRSLTELLLLSLSRKEEKRTPLSKSDLSSVLCEPESVIMDTVEKLDEGQLVTFVNNSYELSHDHLAPRINDWAIARGVDPATKDTVQFFAQQDPESIRKANQEGETSRHWVHLVFFIAMTLFVASTTMLRVGQVTEQTVGLLNILPQLHIDYFSAPSMVGLIFAVWATYAVTTALFLRIRPSNVPYTRALALGFEAAWYSLILLGVFYREWSLFILGVGALILGGANLLFCWWFRNYTPLKQYFRKASLGYLVATIALLTAGSTYIFLLGQDGTTPGVLLWFESLAVFMWAVMITQLIIIGDLSKQTLRRLYSLYRRYKWQSTVHSLSTT